MDGVLHGRVILAHAHFIVRQFGLRGLVRSLGLWGPVPWRTPEATP